MTIRREREAIVTKMNEMSVCVYCMVARIVPLALAVLSKAFEQFFS